jgi:signal transduction histidine kinase/pSer/pThr/pTyr-binding forkhead associated (FHA) protein
MERHQPAVWRTKPAGYRRAARLSEFRFSLTPRPRDEYGLSTGAEGFTSENDQLSWKGGAALPRLIVTKGVDEGKQFDLTGEQVGIGRDSSNRIKLHDTEVSRRHAEFARTAEGYRLIDRGSVNGTFVNNQSICDVLLQPGDQIQIGQTILVYSGGAREGNWEPPLRHDLADQISLITRQDLELSSAIVQSIGETEGSRILANPEEVEGPWLKNALANLMYQATQAVSHILDLNQLLERILELIFRHLDADRGCIMLRDSPANVADSLREPGNTRGASVPLVPDSAEFQPKAVRWRDGINRKEKISISRTIMDYVLREKQGILVSDVARDERFQAVQSIIRHGISEIICVPMKGRHETLGVLYLDARTPSRDPLGAPVASGKPAQKFTREHLFLASAMAHQAALAVEETRYYQAMVQAERLAAVGQTIAALSHHIKNILQGLRSGSEILKMGLNDMDSALLQQGWKNIEKNQAKIYDLVVDMLSYSKEREPNIESTDLNAVAGDVIELLAPRANELGIELVAVLKENLPKCPADAEGIHRALLNIVGNALDAVDGVEAPRVLVSTTREEVGEWLRFEVRDNGGGIPPEKTDDIFRPFVSSKGARGTGLGLAVSRKILREHGGDILLRSQPGQGSLFILRLPLRTPLSSDTSGTRTDLPTTPPSVEG